MNTSNLIERKTILVFLIISITFHACALNNPQAVRNFAISALCDFPPFSGNNKCREVEIVRFIEEDASRLSTTNEEYLKCWCVELEYIDYTGESGFASVWVIESVNNKDFILYKGPTFGATCERLY